jgi:hypothetical protein
MNTLVQLAVIIAVYVRNERPILFWLLESNLYPITHLRILFRSLDTICIYSLPHHDVQFVCIHGNCNPLLGAAITITGHDDVSNQHALSISNSIRLCNVTTVKDHG